MRVTESEVLARAAAGRRARVLVAVLSLGLAVPGCASYRGARLYHQGTEALERGETELAIHQLERAALLVPQASEIQNHLGLAYLEGGRRDDAVRAFDRAVALDCDNAAARENLEVTRAVAARAAKPDAEAGVAAESGEQPDAR